MNIFITYSDEKYAGARHCCAFMARWVGRFDKVIEYSPTDIDARFKKSNAKTFAWKRGAGLWLWKSYVILKTLNEIANEGDVVFYADAGTFFIRSFKHILRTMTDDVWVSNIPLAEKQFSKRETIVLMGCQGKEYEDTPQIQGGFVGIRKSPASVRFVEEWLHYSCDYRLLSPDLNPKYPESDCFVAHREDQSILSLLSKKHGITAHKDPTQFGRFPEKYSRPHHPIIENSQPDEYPIMMILHRKRKVEMLVFLKQLMHVILPRFMVNMFLSKEYFRK